MNSGFLRWFSEVPETYEFWPLFLPPRVILDENCCQRPNMYFPLDILVPSTKNMFFLKIRVFPPPPFCCPPKRTLRAIVLMGPNSWDPSSSGGENEKKTGRLTAGTWEYGAPERKRNIIWTKPSWHQVRAVNLRQRMQLLFFCLDTFPRTHPRGGFLKTQRRTASSLRLLILVAWILMACRSVLSFCRVFAARNPISALKFLYQDDPQRSSSSRKTNLQNRIVGAQLLGSCNQTPERPRGSFGGTLWDAGSFAREYMRTSTKWGNER